MNLKPVAKLLNPLNSKDPLCIYRPPISVMVWSHAGVILGFGPAILLQTGTPSTRRFRRPCGQQLYQPFTQ